MTTNPAAVDGLEDAEEAARLMKKKGVRSLPVVHDGAFVGVVTATDVSNHLPEIKSGEAMEREELLEMLEGEK